MASLRARLAQASTKDLLAGIVLTAFLLPVGMGYAQASGLPPVYGLYATIIPLLAYAVTGPSRLLVLGPDSSLAPLIAATILPLAAGDPDRAVALAGALAVGSGVICLLAGFARFGFLSELLSTPVRYGYLNGIAIVVILSQLPRLLGITSTSDSPLGRLGDTIHAISEGAIDWTTFAIGVGSTVALIVQRRIRPSFPGVMMVIVAGAVIVAAADLVDDVAVVGKLPTGLPTLTWPTLELSDSGPIVAGAFTIAVVTFADTGLLSKAYAKRLGEDTDTNKELIALGTANITTGIFQGFPVSASSSRTPVAEAAGATSQLTGIVAAASISVILVFLPDLFADLPLASLSAVVVIAVFNLIEVPAVVRLRRHRPGEFWLSLIAAAGVVLFDALWGIGLAVLISLLAFIERGRRPHTTTLVKLKGVKGYHDLGRHEDGRHIPGVLLYRFDAPLFFANAALFRDDLLVRIDNAPDQIECVVVTAEPITNIDATADEMLRDLSTELAKLDISLTFAELKGVVRDELEASGTADAIGKDQFHPTIGRAISAHRRRMRETEQTPDS